MELQIFVRAIKAKAARSCRCLYMLALERGQALLLLLLLPGLSVFSPSSLFFSVSGLFCSLLVMKFLACLLSASKCSPAALEEILDLSGNNLISGKGLPHFKGLYYK